MMKLSRQPATPELPPVIKPANPRICPDCGSVVPAGMPGCPDCAHTFPPNRIPAANDNLAVIQVPELGSITGRDDEWRDVPEWPEYQVSSCGDVRRATPATGAVVGRILKQQKNKKTGYLSVCLSRYPHLVRVDVHRLVALAFLGPKPSDAHLVAHNDGSRTNNHVSNIRWATQSENLNDCRLHGTLQIGSANPMTHLLEIDACAIHRMKATGIPRHVIANGYGLHKRSVFRILSRDSWGHL
jgi:hypothetical protein